MIPNAELEANMAKRKRERLTTKRGSPAVWHSVSGRSA